MSKFESNRAVQYIVDIYRDVISVRLRPTAGDPSVLSTNSIKLRGNIQSELL